MPVRDHEERITMNEEEKVGEPEQTQEAGGAEEKPRSQEFKVQAEDLFRTINDLIREGTTRRITVLRNDRVLIDIPLVAGAAASLLLAIYMPYISAIVAVGALFGGCTVRIEREEPK
jgi:hypothetical protein